MAGHSLIPSTNPSSKPPARSTKNFKCLYCFQKGHTISRCHIVSYDQQKGLIKRIGSEFWLSDSSPILVDPWRPIKEIVNTFSATHNHQPVILPPPSTDFSYSLSSTAATKESTIEEDLGKVILSSAQTTEETNRQVVDDLPSPGSIKVRLNGSNCEGLLYPGWLFNFISEDLYLEVHPQDILLPGVCDDDIKITGIALASLSLEGNFETISFLFTPRIRPIILGKPFLNDFLADIDLSNPLAPKLSILDSTGAEHAFPISPDKRNQAYLNIFQNLVSE
ncbi:uncharacterized protein PGTG_19087 [Puccinia graminis f. sp. tritici CRL 75-36-700-3]|uniref:Uncharacterized protein n=1 Tax=Puccinia graminis f. sp. tritici (strain CRL 75-36-700-3 / race SCCL) TaxID=418459 RepID=E3L9X9_PUCGT|nr:uncharacterized protein PGTG_19087 [Puccinia graminis f. sp. tritici CRL 75-36-700-3]EFP93354.1 hypothetical protein PGTG_19087 [Puccinia graminis f. sp. tritici CRL 75-36-700-3]